MVRQSELSHVLTQNWVVMRCEHIHGEGIMDVFRSVGSKLFGKTAKELAKKGAKLQLKSSHQNW